MITNLERNFLNEKIDSLYRKGFFTALKNNDLFNWVRANSLDGFDVNFDGISKCVVIFDDSNYVIKISRTPNKDYCLLEAENYKKAINLGLDPYFAKTFFFKNVDGINLFLQEKVEISDYHIEDDFILYAEKHYPRDEMIYDINEYYDVLCDIVSDFDTKSSLRAVFGESYETDELISFCEKNNINDMHYNNLGFKNGFPIIIDFSGFHG